MTAHLPLVSIGIPTCNRSGLLALAVDSALAQTYSNIQVIVSDNASSDATEEVLAGYGQKIVVCRHNENLGMSRNWESCLSKASGEYFLLLSDDDYLEPDAVELLLSGFEAEPDVTSFVYGRTRVLYPDGSSSYHPVTPPASEDTFDFVMECYRNRRFSPTGATLFRTVDMRSAGGYLRDGFNLVTDTAMLMRTALMQPGRKIAFVNKPVFNYRIHESNLTGTTRLKVWADEIERLSTIVMELASTRQEYVAGRISRYRDRYLISFILSQAKNNVKAGRTSLFDCIRLCKPYLRFHSLKTFCFGMFSLLCSRSQDAGDRKNH